MELGLSNKVGNVMGVILPHELRKQLQIRSAKNLSIKGSATQGVYDYERSTENIQYLENKTAFVRLVSSVNIEGESLEIFNRKMASGIKFQKADDPAKYFILSAGTSIYRNDNGNYRYDFRSGISGDGLGAYGNIGSIDEIKNYGYRPMPGITEAKIQTQGRLGSVRQATISFKVWSKDQLDIIDALYFKMGYMMFLEWGHTYYYDNNSRLVQMGLTIDPFQEGLTKEKLNILIAQKKEQTFGNYDAMLGMCTQFNFDFNQEGGYDCTIKMIGLGALADSSKINVAANIPAIQKELIAQLFQFYREYLRQKEIAEREEEKKTAAPTQTPTTVITEKQTLEQYLEFIQKGITSKDPGEYTIAASDTALSNLKESGTAIAVDATGKKFYVYKDLKFKLPASDEEKENDLYKEFEFDKDAIEAYISRAKKLISGVFFHDVGDYGYTRKGAAGTMKVRYDDRETTAEYGGEDGTEVTIQVYSVLQSGTNNKYYPFSISMKLPLAVNGLAFISNDEGANELTFRKIRALSNPNYEVAGFTAENESHTHAAWIDLILENTLQELRTFASQPGGAKGIIVDETRQAGSPKWFNYDVESGNGSIPLIFYTTYDTSEDTLKLAEKDAFDYQKRAVTLGDVPDEYYFTLKWGLTVNQPVYAPLLQQQQGASGTSNEFAWQNTPVAVIFRWGPDPSIIKNAVVDPEKIKGKEKELLVGFKDTTTAAKEAEEEAKRKKEEEDAKRKEAEEIQKAVDAAASEESLKYTSGLETFLRTIQLAALNSAISNNNNVFELQSVSVVDLTSSKIGGKPLIDQLFSSGIFAGMPRDFIDKIDIISKKGLEVDSGKRDRLLSFASYGFNHNMMGSSNPKAFVEKYQLKTCDFKGMFNAWVLPYNINSEILKGMDTSHPVYIRLDLLLMALNSMCLLYDTPKSSTTGEAPKLEDQVPIIYLDFNTYTNTCLTSPLHMSIDVLKFLIPFRGSNEQYRLLFNREVYEESRIPELVAKMRSEKKTDKQINEELGTQIQSLIKKDLVSEIERGIPGTENSEGEQFKPIFKPADDDHISGYLPDFKDPNNTVTGAWQGRIMNVLVSVDYLLNLCQSFSNNDDSNGVYLKPFLEQILADLNKSMGDINMFRLSYDDKSNCLVIVDDQSSPLNENEKSVETSFNSGLDTLPDVDFNPNSPELPLYGRKSIAKSLSIKTEVSTKLSNMLAISANSNKKSDAGKDATPFGQYNKDFVNRYMSQARVIDPDNQKPKLGEIKAAAAFNDFIISIFNSTEPQVDNIDSAKNFYIEKMNDKKGERLATRASAMIPVSINFKTDGIAGLAMGHAFTIPQQLLPTTYERFKEATGKRVGFVVVGLDHTISNNVWDTDVKANMFFMKKTEDYYISQKYFNTSQLNRGSVVSTNAYTQESVTPADVVPYTPGTPTSGGDPSAMLKAMSQVFKSGGASGLCARYTYSLAKSYLEAKNGNNKLTGLTSSGGNANDESYRKNLMALGYKMQNLGTLTKQQLIAELNKSRAIGDIINYASLKPVSQERESNYAYIYGHTQIYHGENGYNLATKPGKSGTSGWASSWSNNYAANFVYGSKDSDQWEAYLFTLT